MGIEKVNFHNGDTNCKQTPRNVLPSFHSNRVLASVDFHLFGIVFVVGMAGIEELVFGQIICPQCVFF